MHLTRSALTTIATLSCSAAFAQSAIRTWYGTVGDQMGSSVAGIGDINGDGYDEVVVGMPYDNALGYHTGRAVVFSGQNGLALYSIAGASGGDEYGWSVAAAGDVNNDNIPDWMVGARAGLHNGNRQGYVKVYSGANGNMIWTWYGLMNGDQFGASVAGGVDVNHDGWDDCVVGAPFEDGLGVDGGSMWVFNGKTGAVMTHLSDDAGNQYGSCVANVGDITGDGHADFAASSPKFDLGRGRVFFYSGYNGSYQFVLDGVQTGENFGFSVSGGFDGDDDGYADIVVGAPFVDIGGNNSGRASLYSGRTGVLFTSFYGASANDQYGWSVATLGDVNGDGNRDLAVGTRAASPEPGYCSVIDGILGSLIYVVHGEQQLEGFGCSVADAGDVDDDGHPDLIVGAQYHDQSGELETGMARVFSGDWVLPTNYCVGKLNSLGCMPQMQTIGKPSYGTPQQFLVQGYSIVNNRPGVMLYGTQPANTPFQGG